MKKIAYLGPENTYTEKAAKELAGKIVEGTELVGMVSIEVVAKSVALQEVDFGVMAYYNYLRGLVQESLDLIYENDLRIIDMQRLPVVLSIGMHEENQNMEEIYSHPKALAQCSEWLWSNYRESRQIPASSTAGAVRKVAEEKSGLAIANSDALNGSNLEVIAEDIGNRKNDKRNFTDFYLVSHEDGQEEDKSKVYFTMVAITPHTDKPGLLSEILQQVSYHGLNNAKIHSRPALDDVLVGGLEAQMFYLEIMRHKDDEDFSRCVDSLRYKLTPKGKSNETVRVLGSYEKPNL